MAFEIYLIKFYKKLGLTFYFYFAIPAFIYFYFSPMKSGISLFSKEIA